MTFTIDVDLIENNEVRLTENASGNLEIVHVPSGKSFEIDTSEKSSSIPSDHNDLSGIGSSDHHSRYSDSEAVSAVESDGTLSINITGNADEVDGYDIQKNGSDSNGIINFKT